MVLNWYAQHSCHVWEWHLHYWRGSSSNRSMRMCISGTPAIWKLMKFMEGSRFFAHHALSSPGENNFVEYDVLTKDRMTFMGSTEFLINKAMYDRSVLKCPLDVKLRLHHVGKSSLSTQAKVFVHQSDNVLLSNINQVVSIDPLSRKPMPLPDWWKTKYAGMASGGEPMVIQSESRPDGATVYDVPISWSDTDFYEHTNWTSYVKYCIDAANACCIKGQLRQISKETVKESQVKTLRVRYSGESILGDTLKIYAWETPELPNSIKFQVYKETSPICFVFIEYFEHTL